MLVLAFACAHHDAPPPADGTAAPPPDPGELWLSGWFSNAVARLDPETGALLDRFEDVSGPQAIVARDGAVYVVAEGDGAILRWDGDALAPFATGLVDPTGLVPLPDGAWAVGSYSEDRVLRVEADGTLGATLATGLDGADLGMALDAAGRLWVPCYDADEVVVLDDGAPVTRLTVRRPRAVVFAPDGTALVSSWSLAGVVRFGPDGAPLGTFDDAPYATGLAIDGDAVWTASDQEERVLLRDLATGRVLDRVRHDLDGVTGVLRLR